MAEVFENGEKVLVVDRSGTIYNMYGQEVGAVVYSDQIVPYTSTVCRVEGKGRVVTDQNVTIGFCQGGKVLDMHRTPIGQASGELRAEGGAALLAFRAARRGQPVGAAGVTPQHDPVYVVIDRPTVTYDSGTYTEPSDPTTNCITAVILIVLAATAALFALVFVAVSSPIWIGMLACAFIATNAVVRSHIHEVLDQESSWRGLSMALPIRRYAVCGSLLYGMAASTIFIIIDHHSPATAAYCLGAMALGLVLLWRFLDRYGRFSCRTHFGTAEPGERAFPRAVERYAGYSCLAATCIFLIAILISSRGWQGQLYPASTLSTSTSTLPSFPSTSSQPQSSPVPGGLHPTPGQSNTPIRDVVAQGSTKNAGMPGEHFPQTRTRLMDQSEIDRLNFPQTRYAINEAYARHGLSFRTTYIRDQFLKMSWYKPVSGRYAENSAGLLTEIEKRNVDRLVKRKAQLRASGQAGG